MEVLSLLAARIPSANILTFSLRRAYLHSNPHVTMAYSTTTDNCEQSKLVWIWTESRQVMTTAVERGWNTFVFSSEHCPKELANEWSSIALIRPLFMEGPELFDEQNRRIATFCNVSSPQELDLLQPNEKQGNNLVINFQGDWQALEQGLDGVVLKTGEIEDILKLKDYFDTRTEIKNLLNLTKATITRVEVLGMGDRVCVDLCSLMRPGEGLLVGSFARGLFLVHSECLESNYIASRPFRVNAGPVHAYVAVPNGKTCYLSELKAGKDVLVVDQRGLQRMAIVGRVKIESRPLVLVEAKDFDDNTYSIFLQNAETVGLICPFDGERATKTAIPVTSLKVGDEVMFRVQGGARHTGIEIEEFIVEK